MLDAASSCRPKTPHLSDCPARLEHHSRSTGRHPDSTQIMLGARRAIMVPDPHIRRAVVFFLILAPSHRADYRRTPSLPPLLYGSPVSHDVLALSVGHEMLNLYNQCAGAVSSESSPTGMTAVAPLGNQSCVCAAAPVARPQRQHLATCSHHGCIASALLYPDHLTFFQSSVTY